MLYIAFIGNLLVILYGLAVFVFRLILIVICIRIFRFIITSVFQLRRSYFYEINGEYLRKLGPFNFGVNKRNFLKSKTIGFIKKNAFSVGDSEEDRQIYIFTNFGPLKKGYVKIEDNVANVYLSKKSAAGSTSYNKVGFVNEKGEIFKYYPSPESVRTKDDLSTFMPEKIGECEVTHKIGSKKPITGEDIPSQSNAWYALRREYNDGSKEAIILQDKKAAKDGRFYFFWDLLLWIRVYVFPENFDRFPASQGFGYGFCRENGRIWWPWGKEGASIPLVSQAAAVLLLYRDGFVDSHEDEQAPDDRLGPIASALFSLLVFLSISPAIWYFIGVLFPFLGEQFSKNTSMLLIFLLIWYCVQQLRKLFFQNTIRFEKFLFALNSGTGTKGISTTIIILSLLAIGMIILGAIFSFNTFSYPFFSIFLCILIAFLFNRGAYKNFKWPIDEPFSSDYEPDKNDFSKEDEKEDAISQNYQWQLDDIFSENKLFQFDLTFYKNEIQNVRNKNPRYLADNPGSISWDNLFQTLIQEELTGHKYFKGDEAAAKINAIFKAGNFNEYEKIAIILKFVQNDNIIYKFDHECEEVKNIDDYWRFPTETLYDRHGDCECKAILAFYFLKKLQFDVIFLVVDTEDPKVSHAAIGVSLKETSILKGITSTIPHKNKSYYYCETTGEGWRIGVVPENFKSQKIRQIFEYE